jgi:hypothetical protein
MVDRILDLDNRKIKASFGNFIDLGVIFTTKKVVSVEYAYTQSMLLLQLCFGIVFSLPDL